MTDSNPSKSAIKRDYLELQQLGETLLSLNDADLVSLQLDDRLLAAVRRAKSIKSRSALRRQKQLIGKLMRDIDPHPVRAGIAALKSDDLRSKRIFSSAERWRDRFVSDGNSALDEFQAQTGSVDDELRALLSEYHAAASDKAEKTVRRQIFRRIHHILSREISAV